MRTCKGARLAELEDAELGCTLPHTTHRQRLSAGDPRPPRRGTRSCHVFIGATHSELSPSSSIPAGVPAGVNTAKSGR
jgi:hypothetical protein